MPKTIEQILANHAAHAVRSEKGMIVAKESGNYQLASLNCRQSLKSWMMQGLIAWRCGENPTQRFEQAISRFAEDWQSLQEIGGESAKLSDAGYEQVYFVAHLVNQPLPFSAQASAADGLQCDRLLDAVLGRWLFDDWDAPRWEAGIQELQKRGSKLAVETYEFYRHMTQNNEDRQFKLEETADELFVRRRNDTFFAEGVQTSGGGPDNDFTVDYRFAALVKHVGRAVENIHAWRW